MSRAVWLGAALLVCALGAGPALGQAPASPSTVQEALDLLGDASRGREAELLLVELARRAPVEGLAGRLRVILETGGERARAALIVLAALEGRGALPELVAATARPELRRAALGALAEADRAGPAWGDDADAASSVRGAVEGALLDDRASRLDQAMALQALRVWGDVGSVAPILEHLSTTEAEGAATSKLALHALTELAGPRGRTTAEWRGWWAGLAATWADYPRLLEAVRAGGDGALDALPRVGRIPDRRTVDAIDALAEQLTSPGAWSEAEAARSNRLVEEVCRALAQVGDPAGATPLLRLLEARDASRAARAWAVWALSSLSGTTGGFDPAAWRELFPDALYAGSAAPEGARPKGLALRRGEARVARRDRAPAGALEVASPPTTRPPSRALPEPPAVTAVPTTARSTSSGVSVTGLLACVLGGGLLLLLRRGPTAKAPLLPPRTTRSVARMAAEAEELEEDDALGVCLNPAAFRGETTAAPGPDSERMGELPGALRSADAAPFQALGVVVRRIATLERVAVRLSADGPTTPRRVLFDAAAAGSLDEGLATLLQLGGLVVDVALTVRGCPLELVVFERAVSVGAGTLDPDWQRLLALVGRGGAAYDRIEARADGLWRTVQAPGDGPAEALARLGSLGPEAVDEVRGQLRGGPRVLLHVRRGGRPRAAGSPWSELVERLQRAAHLVEALEVDDGGGWRDVFVASDAPRFAAARARLRDCGEAPARALLRGSGLVVPLVGDLASRDALLDDLGLEALERLELGDELLFQATDDAARLRVLQAIVRSGPSHLRALRARLGGGPEGGPEPLEWTNEAEPAPHEAPARAPVLELDTASIDDGATARASLEGALDALQRLAPTVLAACAVRLTTSPEPVVLSPRGGESAGVLAAARALGPLVEQVVVRLRGCPLDLVMWERPARLAAHEASRGGSEDFLRGLQETLEAFAVVEVREAGRLWRTVKDATTSELEALTALGSLRPDALCEVRAQGPGGERRTLWRAPATREGVEPPEGPSLADAWTALLSQLHSLGRSVESITLVDPVWLQPEGGAAAGRTLFTGADAARFAEVCARLRGWEVDRLALRLRLRGSGVELPLEGSLAKVTTALEELGPGAVLRVALDEPGAASLFEAQDAALLGAAIGALVALDPARVGEVRVRPVGQAERVLFPAG